MTRNEAVEFLLNRPADYAKLLGFTKLGDLHNEWIKEMVRGRTDKTLQASRETYKTTCVSIALAIIIILLPSKKVLFMRKTDNDTKEVINQVYKLLMDPHTQYFVQTIYGCTLRAPVKNSSTITTNLAIDTRGTNQILGLGIGGSLTGKHFDIIFTDDIVNLKDRISRSERETTKLVYQELQNIKNRGGKIFNTGTPWHADDCFSIMPVPEKYDCYHPAFKDMFTPDILEEKRKSMTKSLFAANYELRHVAEDDVLFTSPQTGADPQLCMQGTSHLDSAYYGEDYTAFTVCNVHDGKFYVFGKCWRKHIDDVTEQIKGWHDHFLCGKMYTELNADKGYVAGQFRLRGVKVATYTEHENKYVKISSHLKFEWENVIFVEGTDPEYINQICDYNENAEHDDCPDSLASLIRIMAKKKNREPYKPLIMGGSDENIRRLGWN